MCAWGGGWTPRLSVKNSGGGVLVVGQGGWGYRGVGWGGWGWGGGEGGMGQGEGKRQNPPQGHARHTGGTAIFQNPGGLWGLGVGLQTRTGPGCPPVWHSVRCDFFRGPVVPLHAASGRCGGCTGGGGGATTTGPDATRPPPLSVKTRGGGGSWGGGAAGGCGGGGGGWLEGV